MLNKMFAKKTNENKAIAKKRALESEITNKLLEYGQKDGEVLYYTLRKVISDYFGYWTDLGYIGIASTNYENLFYIGDVLTYSSDGNFIANDIVRIRQHSEDGFYIYHGNIKSFTKDGGIQIQDPDGIYVISPDMIIGKLIQVTTIWDDGWKELFDKMSSEINIQSVTKLIKENMELYASSEDLPEIYKGNIIPELEKRLIKLESERGKES